jgi:peptide/nickel transport system permease protein
MSTGTATGTEFSGDLPAALVAEGQELPPGLGPYKLAWRRLKRNRVALFFGGLFVVVVVLCLLAPVYASDVAHTTPDANHITDKIKIGGHLQSVVSVLGNPIGPTWHSKFFLGADPNGRDVAVRLLYGGRNSLEVGVIATLITMILAVILGTVAGYFRGISDGIITRLLDVIWAYPAVLLGVALGTALAVGGLNLGLFSLHGNSLGVPATVIGIVYVPYVAKPIRGQVLTLREREFIDAARQQGLSHVRIMATEVLPNLASTILVFVPLILANAILLEAALSFLGAGVRPPHPSWGTMIADALNSSRYLSAFHLVLVPGVMLVLTVLSINVFGDGLRDALDPRLRARR